MPLVQLAVAKPTSAAIATPPCPIVATAFLAVIPDARTTQ